LLYQYESGRSSYVGIVLFILAGSSPARKFILAGSRGGGHHDPPRCINIYRLTMIGVCAVVGCGPGLGGSAAIKFAREGFAIAAFNRTPETFAPTKDQLESIGAKYAFFSLDSTDASAVKNAFAEASNTLGKIDVLVYNAGGGGFGKSIMDIDPNAFRNSFDVSCTGALLCTQAVIPGMLASPSGQGVDGKSKKCGTIIYSSATAAFRGGSKMAQFACGKFALRGLSQSVAREYQPQGIHVVHVRIDAILDTPSYKARFASQNEAGVLGSCDEIANTYYALYQQSLGCLSNEIDVRPFQEKWSC
jgi:NAD(P)-dependent dehydrogenase (short-subunit alcohol dehydrogenase family)